jgi:class 3 adenylate cyclase
MLLLPAEGANVKRDLAYFQQRLHIRNHEPPRAGTIDAELWSELGAEQAILVGDMSGFTRLTKKRGIIHFLAMHAKGMELGMPVVADHSGALVKSEADNFIACFAEPVSAARSAIALVRAFETHNASVPDPDSHVLYCFGIGYGRVLRLSDDVFGDEVNVAYKLGEDIARPNEVLVSELAHAAIVAATDNFGFSSVAHADAGNVRVGYYRLAVH